MLKQQTEDIIRKEMKEIEDFQKKSNMSLFESLFPSIWQTKNENENKEVPTNRSNKILDQNLKVKKQKKVRGKDKWTEKDTNSMMDLMEVALKRVKEKLVKKRRVEDKGLEGQADFGPIDNLPMAGGSRSEVCFCLVRRRVDE